MDKLFKVLTDPVSNRIIQLIRIKGEMSISEIISADTGISRATIYRKIEKMLEVGAISVAYTNKVRGQIENVYKIENIFIKNTRSNEDNLKMVTMSIMNILTQYEKYFKDENADVVRDKLAMFNYGIKLNDADYSSMLTDILKVVDSYQDRGQSEGAKQRNLYLLSAPGGNI